jgi:Tfp pilus assembly protein PilF
MPISDSEEIDVSNVDASGDLLTGHMISTTALEPGTYRLVVTATDEKQHKAYTAMSFHIVPWSETTEIWTAYSTDAADNQSEALDDYKRGLSALAQSHTDQAVVWFKRSLTDNTQYLPALDGLVDTLTHSNHFAEVAALSKEHPVSHELKERTVILMAEANGQIGHPEVGARILEAELQFQTPSKDLYLALAKLYQSQGDTSKSEEFKRRAATLKN